MRKHILLTFALLCLLAVQGFAADPAIPEFGPNSTLGKQYLAQSCLTTTPGPGACGTAPGDFGTRPEAFVWVTIFVTPVAATGFHSHETVGPRPYPTILPAPRIQTGTDGLAHWTIQNNGWSGLYNIVFVAEDKTTSDRGLLHFPTKGEQYYLAITVPDKNGILHTFDKFHAGANLYTDGYPVDGRHLDSQGNFGYNVWGTRACIKAIETGAERYLVSVANSRGLRMKLRRISLPDGGNADNEIDANGNYLFPIASWAVRKGEVHAYGKSYDLLNPKLAANQSDDIDMKVEYLRVYTLLHRLGIYLGEVKPDGTPISTNPPNSLARETDLYNFWYGQSMTHWVCGLEPTLLP
jgi:hypothetical protein